MTQLKTKKITKQNYISQNNVLNYITHKTGSCPKSNSTLEQCKQVTKQDAHLRPFHVKKYKKHIFAYLRFKTNKKKLVVLNGALN